MSYAIALVHEEDGVFGISFPDFPGCISTGGSFDEAVTRGGQALSFHIEGMLEDREALPVLRTASQIRTDPDLKEAMIDATLVAVPVTLPGKAVRVNITLDEHLLTAIDRAAGAQGSSRSGFLADAARRQLGR